MFCIATPAKICFILFRKCIFLHSIIFAVVLALTLCDVFRYICMFLFFFFILCHLCGRLFYIFLVHVGQTMNLYAGLS